MDTRASSRIPFPEIATPHLAALYDGVTRASVDMDKGDALRINNPTAIPLFRQDALAFTPSDELRFKRMSLAWGKMKGEPKKRRARKSISKWKGKTKRKRKVKRKTKWIPRKQYLAGKRN